MALEEINRTLTQEEMTGVLLGFFDLIDGEISLFKEPAEAEKFLEFLLQLSKINLLFITREETQRHLREHLTSSKDYFQQLTNLWVKMKAQYLGEELMLKLVKRMTWSLNLTGPHPSLSQAPIAWRTHGFSGVINGSVLWGGTPEPQKDSFMRKLIKMLYIVSPARPTHQAVGEQLLINNEHVVLIFLLSLANAYLVSKDTQQ
jgi:hypothetical protein